MKKTPLTLFALLVAISASGDDCGNNRMKSFSDLSGFNLIKDSKGNEAVSTVGFCEGGDYVVDIVYLAGDDQDPYGDSGEYIILHELSIPAGQQFATNANFTDLGWFRTDKIPDLKKVNMIIFLPSGSCANPGDFTRSTKTGSGFFDFLKFPFGGLSSLSNLSYPEIDLCGHGMDSNNTVRVRYVINKGS